MRICFYIRTLLLTVMCCMLTCMPVLADGADAPASVHDEAGLFSDSEILELEAMAQKYGRKSNVRYYIVTQNVFLDQSPYAGGSTGIGAYTEALSEAFYEAVAKPAGGKDAVIFTIVIEYAQSSTLASGAHTDRYADVSGHGYGQEYLDDERAQMVFDKIRPLLSESDHLGAAKMAIQTADRYMKFHPGIDPSLLIFRLWFQILLCLAAGGIITASMVHHSGGRITTNGRTYMDAAGLQILARRDRYLRTTVTKVKKQERSGTSGRNSSPGGQSRSAGSHSRGSHGGGHF